MEEIDFEADVKLEVLKEIFLNMSKNTRENESVFFCFDSSHMQIGMKEASKASQLELVLHKNTFSSYKPSSSHKVIRKFNLTEFSLFHYLFEPVKGEVHLTIDKYRLTIKYENGPKKSIKFVTRCVYMDEEEEGDLIEKGFVYKGEHPQNSDTFKLLKFNKAKLIKEVVHTGNTMKVDTIAIAYKKGRFIMALKKSPLIQFSIKVEEIEDTGEKLENLEFEFKKFKLATGMLESEKYFEIHLYPTHIEFAFEEADQRTFSIIICANIDSLDP